MQRHISVVNKITMFSMGNGGVVQIGDTNNILMRSRAVAVQRELPIYRGSEIEFTDFVVFTDTDLTVPTRVTDVRMQVVNVNPFICVDDIEFANTENAGVFHIGSVDYVQSNSRILQIRQYLDDGDETDTPSALSSAYNGTTRKI